MQIKAVLFDLDGTLLPMDQEVFLKSYLGMLSRALAPHGYDPQKLVKAIKFYQDEINRLNQKLDEYYNDED